MEIKIMSVWQRQMQSGFSLIEVMVALVVLSVGLLGLAGMQVSGLRTVGNTTDYSIATLAVNDLAERMRANPIGLSTGNYLVDFTTIDCSVALATPWCAARPGVAAATCTPVELAQYDIYSWYCGDDTTGSGMSNILSITNPATIITCNAGTDPTLCPRGTPYVIDLQWSETNQNNANEGATTAATTTQSVYMRINP
jgi:type IV pilus assembly protein PilV